ncbi:amidohydrolase [Virgibacillus xinjiangensis]|uniref:Amidohydrolase n=1 Tax=Virgibacillus xinjiangensis TaxID=393090 RepID=A0ABV7CU32_9BACI
MKKATLLFTNGNVLTLDKQNKKAGSVAVANGKIIGIWQSAEPPKDEVEITEETQLVDLEGKTLLPGFVDTHNHILMYALLKDQVNCSTPPNESITDIQQIIEEKVKETPDGEWVIGYGYDDTLLAEKRHPTKGDLDKVAPNHPIIIRHISGHLAVANSLALELGGLEDDASDPDGGHFGRDEFGHLNGVLYEPGAMNPVQEKTPEKTVDEMVEALEEAAQEYLAHGITTNSDAAINTLKELEVHLKAAKSRKNPMRTQLMIMHHLLREGQPFEDYSPAQLDQEIQEKSDGLARLDSAKMFQDGSIQGSA